MKIGDHGASAFGLVNFNSGTGELMRDGLPAGSPADETPTLARTLLIYTVMMEQGIGLPQAEHLLSFAARDVRSFLIDRLQTPLIRREWMELHD